MHIVLFEDNQCSNLYPIGLFQPLYDTRVGSLTLRSLIGRLDSNYSTIVRDHFLVGDNTNSVIESPLGEPCLFVNASVEPDIRYIETLTDVMKAGDPFITTSGNRVAAALVPAGTAVAQELKADNIRSFLLEMGLPLEELPLKTIDWPHEVVKSHLNIFPANLAKIIEEGEYTESCSNCFIGKNVSLTPTTNIETDNGPVVIDDDVRVKHFTHFAGPVHVGRRSLLIEYSSIKDSTSIGPVCKIGGEVEASVIGEYSNKQHHGFLGHSYQGNWVNFGAGSSTSDLKNTYGLVRVQYGGSRVETGMQFFGSIIGDYAKSAVNTSIFTGKIIGVCSMMYGTVTSNVPSFSNYAKSFGQVTEISLDQIITTQKRMFDRRGVKQTDHDVALMRRVFEITRHERTMTEEQLNF